MWETPLIKRSHFNSSQCAYCGQRPANKEDKAIKVYAGETCAETKLFISSSPDNVSLRVGQRKISHVLSVITPLTSSQRIAVRSLF